MDAERLLGGRGLNERRASPTADTIKNQLRAAHPSGSAWVSASAGSGKTHILSERVLRLLLSGVAPENVLCLTYTKAGAAEMAQRVANRLGEWAVMGESELRAALTALANKAPVSAEIDRARTLFAHALETPGGLKISTIHAFCEAALHRFALEARVPVGFGVIEGGERDDMVRAARDAVLAEGLAGDEQVAASVACLFSCLSDHQIEAAVNSALSRPRELKQVLSDPKKAGANLRKLLGLSSIQTVSGVEQEGLAASRFDQDITERVLALTPPGDAGRFEDRLARLDWQNLTLEDLTKTFLTKGGTLPKTGFPKKIILTKDPDLADLMVLEAERLAGVLVTLKHARIAERSEALLAVLAAINKRYEMTKQRQGQLDYDDLITRFDQLVSSREAAQWVRYKLDTGLTHILVDESQDTNPDQWSVVRKLVDEFFAGQSAIERPRSVFAVGDEKQSIYSFQGADPALFGQTGSLLRRQALAAGKPWAKISFRASFRTLANILDAVDLVSARPDIAKALLWAAEPERHESARTDKGGMVTLWPPTRDESENPEGTHWPTQPPEANKTPARRLAERIAGQISVWVTKKRPLARRKRPVTPDDILILVQTRTGLFAEIIRALKKYNLPTPGADRLPVSGHIVVRDLISLGDVLETPQDDLSLASVLRSPLFGLSESQLETLCVGRAKGVSLWRALNARAKTDEFARTALARLVEWRASLDFDRPYEFFAQVLFAAGGLKRFHARLGREIDDVISEFMDLALAHEQSAQPSLRGFLSSLRLSEITVKREFHETGGVRVMTIHGAKGLEAPIVILADAATCHIRYSPKPTPVYVQGPHEPLLAHIPATDEHTDLTATKLGQPEKDAQMAEYWRKLYVGMTRAEDELYVSGILAKKGKLEGTWYQAIEEALKPDCREVQIYGEDERGLRFPAKIPAPLKIKTRLEERKEEAPAPLPGPLPAREEIQTVRPSEAGEQKNDGADLLQSGAQAVVNADAAKRYGVALHALLQHLAALKPGQRQKIARNAVAALLPGEAREQKKLVDKALAIFAGPNAGLLFGPGSRPELPIFVSGSKNGQPVRLIGRIDRVIVQNDQVLVVDFKSNASPPLKPGDVSTPYRVQLGLYLRAAQRLFPALSARAAIYWSASETLMYLPDELLLEATKKFKFN